MRKLIFKGVKMLKLIKIPTLGPYSWVREGIIIVTILFDHVSAMKSTTKHD